MDSYLKVLWVEDTADQDLLFMMPPFYLEATVELDIAATATEGYNFLRRHKYDIIVIDIRIPPGRDEMFTKEFLDEHNFAYANKVGLNLLEAIKSASDILVENKDMEKYGIFSIERKEEISDALEELGIKNYLKKTSKLQSDALLNFVKKIANVNN